MEYEPKLFSYWQISKQVSIWWSTEIWQNGSSANEADAEALFGLEHGKNATWLTLLPFSGLHLHPWLQSWPAHGSSNLAPCRETKRDGCYRQCFENKWDELLCKLKHFDARNLPLMLENWSISHILAEDPEAAAQRVFVWISSWIKDNRVRKDSGSNSLKVTWI